MDVCDEPNDAQYWWIIIIVAIFILLIVIIVLFATWGNKELVVLENAEHYECQSAEYTNIAHNISECHGTFEVNLVAQKTDVEILPGKSTNVYSYDGCSFPGPLIIANKGDKLVVRVNNELDEPTSITWHGLLASAQMDGSEISHKPIEPGESFTYEIWLNQPGLFWYHSDINPVKQVGKGLYGVILVNDENENKNYHLPYQEKVLALSDINCENQDFYQSNNECSNNSNECSNNSNECSIKCGDTLLVNGVHNGCIELIKNVPTRLRIVNCAVDRFMNLFLTGHDMLKIGGDQGLLESPILIKADKGLLLTPGERADIVFVPRTDQIQLLTSANPRNEFANRDVFRNDKQLLVTFNMTQQEEECNLLIPTQFKKIKKIKTDHCTPVIKINYGECDGKYYAFKIESNDRSELSSEKKYSSSSNSSSNKSSSNKSSNSLSSSNNYLDSSSPTHNRKNKESRKIGVPFEELKAKHAPIVFENSTYIIEVTNTSLLANNFFLHGFYFQHIDTIYVSKGEIYSSAEQQTHDLGELDCPKIYRKVNHIIENKDTIYIPGVPNDSLGRDKIIVRLAVNFSSHNDIRNYKDSNNGENRNIIAYGKYPTESRAGGWILGSHILSQAELGQQAFIQIVPECDRSKYTSSENEGSYINSYSKYSESKDHSYCLTKGKYKDSSSNNTDTSKDSFIINSSKNLFSDSSNTNSV